MKWYAKALWRDVTAVILVLLFLFGLSAISGRPAWAQPSQQLPLAIPPALGLQAGQQATPGPVARFVLFYGETCPHCHEVMDNFLPQVYEKYGDQVEYRYIEIYNSPENRMLMVRLLTALGIPPEKQGGVPTLVIGDHVLVGSVEIPAQLESLIDEYLAKGGVDFPSFENLPEVILPTPVPAVEILVVFQQTHPDFGGVNSLITALAQKYGDGLRAYALDLSQEGASQTAAALNRALGVPEPEPGTPEVLVGDTLLVGLQEIQLQLPGLVERHMAAGGLALPDLSVLLAATPQPSGAVPSPSPTPEANTATPTVTPGLALTPLPPTGKVIYILYFFSSGCSECDRVGLDLNFLEKTYRQVQIVRKEIGQEQALAEWMGEQLNVPEGARLTAPALYIGSDYLANDDLVLPTMQATVEKYVATGTEPIWERFGAEEAQEATQRLQERYRSLGALTVLGAGLVNGLNPCAFVTIVFFLSYLTFVGRKGRDVLLVGASFTLGVFVAYLLAGLGLAKLLEPLIGVQATLKLWVFGFTSLLCLALAAISLYDYIKARQGKTHEMKLKLSMDLRRQVNRVIRQGTQMRALYVVAFGIGVLVSLIQLTCTSPIYIGILFLINDVPEMRSNAYLYLLLYNLAYIVPLVVVFVLSYFGTSSQKLGDFITRRTATIKLLTTIVFVVLFGWLIYSLLRQAGVA